MFLQVIICSTFIFRKNLTEKLLCHQFFFKRKYKCIANKKIIKIRTAQAILISIHDVVVDYTFLFTENIVCVFVSKVICL